jgi:hypothetical protein
MRLALLALALALAFSSGPVGAAERDLGVTLLIGVPHPLGLGIDKRRSEKWSYGGTLGALAVPLGREIRLQISNLDARGRWHPFSGAFFLGGMLGIQTILGEANKTIEVSGQQIPTHIELRIDSLYFTPHFGWMGAFGFGLTLGFEVGFQVPFVPNSRLEASIDEPTLAKYLSLVQQTEAYRRLEDDLETTGNKIGLIKFPYVTVLRIGWSF